MILEFEFQFHFSWHENHSVKDLLETNLNQIMKRREPQILVFRANAKWSDQLDVCRDRSVFRLILNTSNFIGLSNGRFILSGHLCRPMDKTN